MARNKITFEIVWGDDQRAHYFFTGSQRQPTLVEINNFICENRLEDDLPDYFGVTHIALKDQEWVPPEEVKTVEFLGYDGGTGDGSCPVCGHERDMSKDVCPVCLRGWE
ncbi:MAG: hypothetical protein IJS96_08935 [Schwartzia sp.]|nr:hypothetical protein [Schwartzia sp. (in: firmicutes)]